MTTMVLGESRFMPKKGNPMNHNDGIFMLTKADCKALLSCICHDDMREHMCAVYFDPRTGSAVTCDGHTLIRAQHYGTGFDAKPYLVPRAAFERAAKNVKRASTDLLHVACGEDGRVMMLIWRTPKNGIREELYHMAVQKLEKQFPSYEQIIPELEPIAGDLAAIAFNPRYLQRAVLMADACGDEGVEWQMPRGRFDPMRATCSCAVAGVTWTCVVMPMRAA